MNYTLVKCSTGELFIGSVIHSSDKTIILENPLKITLFKESARDRVSCCISEWNEISISNNVELNKSHVLYVTRPRPRQDVIDYYLESLNYFSDNSRSSKSQDIQRILH